MHAPPNVPHAALIGLFLLSGAARVASGQMQTPAARLSTTETCGQSGIPLPVYFSLLNKHFTALLGSAQSVPGSFGSLEIDKEQKAKLAVSAQPGGGRILSLEASGGVEDGVLRLINDRESSTSFSAVARLHLLLGGTVPSTPHRRWWRWTMLEYSTASCHAYRAAVARAQDSLELRQAAIAANVLEVRKRRTLARYTDETATIARKLKDATLSTLTRDGLRVDSARVITLLRMAEREAVPSPEDQSDAAEISYGSDLRAAQELLSISGFGMGWLTLTVGVQNTSFRRFDPAAPFASQVSKDSYAAPRVGIAYSRYMLSKFSNESRFWTVAATASLEDNLTTLQKVELTEIQQFGDTPDGRSSRKSYTARQGAYQDNLGAIGLTSDFYQFLFRDNQGAVHLYPGVAFKRKLSPTYTTGIGFLWTARRDKAAFFNAELTYTLMDITEAQSSPDNVWERSQLGLRVTLPIRFNPR